MCKKDLYNRVLEVVVAESEIGGELMQDPKNKTLEVVDARHLLVYFLRNFAGYNIGYIARLTNMTNQSINYILRHFDNRRAQGGKNFENTFQRINRLLENN